MYTVCGLVVLSLLSTFSLATPGYLHAGIEKRQGATSGPGLRRRSSVWNANTIQADSHLEYLIKIGLGAPPQFLSVTLDTGSSDLWVPATSSCGQTECDLGSFDVSKSETYLLVDEGGFNITYAGPGDSDNGDWVSDLVSVAGSGQMRDVQFAVADQRFDQHGVMGLGYDTNEAQSPGGKYQSIIDQMYIQKFIQRRSYGLYLNALEEPTGNIVFGGIDHSKYTGELIALPLQQSLAGKINEFYVTLTSVTFTDDKGKTHQLSPEGYSQSVLLDSGTTSSLMTNDVFSSIVQGFGAVTYNEWGELLVPCSYASQNWSIDYTFGGPNGPKVSVPFSQLLGPMVYTRSEFSDQSGGCDFFAFNNIISGASVLGDTFLRSAYVVYDLDDDIIAIAQAKPDQVSTSNIEVIPSSATTLPGVTSTATATGTQQDHWFATNWVAPSYSTSGSVILAGSPTFGLRPTGTLVPVAGQTTGGEPKTNDALALRIAVERQHFIWRFDVQVLTLMLVSMLCIQC